MDFHNHSNYSDGGDTPAELVERAKMWGVSAMALTDHHVYSGLPEFLYACKREDIFAISFGTEINVELPSVALEEGDNEAPDMIILGKSPKYVEKNMRIYQDILFRDRKDRFIPETMDGLRDIGFHISDPQLNLAKNVEELGECLERIKDQLNNPDNLERLIDYVHEVSSIGEADIRGQPEIYAAKWVFSIGQPGYAKRFKGFSTSDAITLAEVMNCKLFIAHPGGEYGALSDTNLNYFVKTGVHGIETRSYFNTSEQNAKFDLLAKQNGLIRSGGSDCHGDRGPFKIGIYDRPENQVPKKVLKELWENLP
ncbi:MAG: PHP domain-containing protein [Actinomycetota bacterium]